MAVVFKNVLISTSINEAIHWTDNRVSEEDIREYEKENPFPENNFYTLEDFINDAKTAEGAIAFPINTPQEVLDWVEEAIDELYF